MNLLVLTLAVSNIFNWNGNKDKAGDSDFPAFPRKCCDVMELKVPGKEPEEFRFYKAQDVFDRLCEIYTGMEVPDSSEDNYEDFFCNAVVPGFTLAEPVILSDFNFSETRRAFDYYVQGVSSGEDYIGLFPDIDLKNVIVLFDSLAGLSFANFDCGSNEAVSISEQFGPTDFIYEGTKIDASISCKGEEDSDYTWVIVGPALGILVLVVGLVVWAKLRAQRSSLETPFL